MPAPVRFSAASTTSWPRWLRASSNSIPQGNKVGSSSAAAVSGCLQCHGSEVKVLEGRQARPGDLAQYRHRPYQSRRLPADHVRPATCATISRAPRPGRRRIAGAATLVPITRRKRSTTNPSTALPSTPTAARFEPMMEEKEWLPGKEFEQGPTCSVCHMGATKNLPLTHDVGERISWTLRPPVSEKS